MPLSNTPAMNRELQEVLCVHKCDTEPIIPKRLIVCCDGTWYNANNITKPQSNVSRLAGAIAHKCCSGMPQIVHYYPGAGTGPLWQARQLGGLLGLGVTQDIVQVYRFICDNYNPGDEVILIGFSRGAFVARSVANMICYLGILNRAGLDQIPFIFKDYKTLNKWKDQAYNRKEHLLGFTIENLERVQRLESSPGNGGRKFDPKQVPQQLENDKRRLFDSIKGIKENFDYEACKLYRLMLTQHEMIMLSKYSDEEKVPIEGKVRAVGVWDTVGSLGLPRTRFFNSRHEDEIRFDNLEVHPNVDYAFHALALDEWRTAFGPTMWERRDENTSTRLRQVWFPGNHGNVGGGWEDQQIATISLAWMADQLTSVGVAFSKKEMKRIFYSVNSPSVRRWGLGKIYNPTLKTAIWDRLHQGPINWLCGSSAGLPIRTPGKYKSDGERIGQPLLNPGELVHPCVRLRYLYRGKGLNDTKYWACRALTENGYRLVQWNPAPPVRERYVEGALKEYRSLNSVVIPGVDLAGALHSDPMCLKDGQSANWVQVEQPFPGDVEALPAMDNYWAWKPVWSHDSDKVLPEEQVGIWERMFININGRLLAWRNEAEDTDAINGRAPPKKPMPDQYPLEYGYHDIMSWP